MFEAQGAWGLIIAHRVAKGFGEDPRKVVATAFELPSWSLCADDRGDGADTKGDNVRLDILLNVGEDGIGA